MLRLRDCTEPAPVSVIAPESPETNGLNGTYGVLVGFGFGVGVAVALPLGDGDGGGTVWAAPMATLAQHRASAAAPVNSLFILPILHHFDRQGVP